METNPQTDDIPHKSEIVDRAPVVAIDASANVLVAAHFNRAADNSGCRGRRRPVVESANPSIPVASCAIGDRCPVT
jgi:hypothetical protein